MLSLDREELTRRQVLRSAGVGAAVLSLPALLAACGGGQGSGTAPATSSAGAPVDVATSAAEIPLITWSLGSAPPSLDIATGFVANGVAAMSLGLEGLLTLDDQLALKPLLAESWSQPDTLHYVYKLRPGVTFWDGSPVTADDAAFSLNRHLDTKSGSQLNGYFLNVKAIKATGANEVTVTLKRPDVLFQYIPVLAHIVPQAFVEKLGKRFGQAGETVNVMGSGPYKITQFSAENGVKVERNETYWGPKPTVQSGELKFIANPQTSLLAARSGEIDGMFDVPSQQAKDWERLDGVSLSFVPGMRNVYLSFDMEAEPWDDIHVRKAIAHAADRDGYVKAFLGGHGQVAASVVPIAQWGALATPDEVEAMYAKLPQYAYDMDLAKQELSQSNHADGFSARVVYPDQYPEMGRALVSLAESLKQLNIQLDVKQITQNQWLADLYGPKNLGLFAVTLGPDYPDPANYPSLVFPSSGAVKNGFNTANFKNPEVDKLLQQQNDTTDKAARVKAIEQMLVIAAQELPYLPLWFQDSSIAIRDTAAWNGFNSLYYYQSWLAQVKARA